MVLNVGTAHVGEFGSREAIATAKSELVAALPTEGLAVLNADDPAVRAMAAVTTARVVLVGEADDADVRAADVVLDAGGRPSFTVQHPAGQPHGAARAGRRDDVGHALAVLAAATELGMSSNPFVPQWSPRARQPRRMEVVERADGVTTDPRRLQREHRLDACPFTALERMGEAGAPGPCSAPCSSSVSSRRAHAEVGAEVVAAASTSSSSWVRPPRHWPRERAPRARHPAAPARACGRFGRRQRLGAARRGARRGRRRAVQVEPRRRATVAR